MGAWEIFKKIIDEEYLDIDMNDDLEKQFKKSIHEKKVATYKIDKVFKDQQDLYFIFYDNRESHDEPNKIYENILSNLDGISEEDKIGKIKLYAIFNKMNEKILFTEYQKEKKLENEISSKLNEKKIIVKGKNIDINVTFIGDTIDKIFSINIYDRIRSLENNMKKKVGLDKEFELDITGFVFNASLKDIVSIYNDLGDKLFDENLRYSIKDELDVDLNIKNTLEDDEDEFWYLNNGITMIIEDDDFKLRKSDSIQINYNIENKVSVINGAQTISAAASYIYGLKEDRKNFEPRVIFRIIHIKKPQCNEDDKVKLDNSIGKEIKKISISLNRQKPIKKEDLAYATSFVDSINQLYETKDKKYRFKIDKRSKEVNEGYDLLYFAKLIKSYLVQEPGSALNRSADILLKLKDGELEDENMFKTGLQEDASLFEQYYRPVNFASRLENSYFKYKSKYKGKKSDALNYGRLYFIAYIIYVLNGKQNTDFSTFDYDDEVDDVKIDYIISKYIEVFEKYIEKYIEKHKEEYEEQHNKELKITIQNFKNNDLYKEFRDFNDRNSDLNNDIQELEQEIMDKFKVKS